MNHSVPIPRGYCVKIRILTDGTIEVSIEPII